MEELHSQLREYLEKLIKTKKIKNYLFFSALSNLSSSGVEGDKIGGAYMPITDSTNFSGELLVEWPDGEISKASVNNTWLEEFDKRIELIYELKYRDNAAKVFLEKPIGLHLTNQADKKITENKYNKEKELVSRVSRLHDWMANLGEKSRHIRVDITSQKFTVSNSKGLVLEEDRSIATQYASLGDIYNFEISERSIKTLSKAEDIHIKRAESFYKILSCKSQHSLPPITKVILLMPDIFSMLLRHFLIFNISADSIYYKESRFKLSNFKERKKIASEKMSLEVLPKLEMKVSACNFSNEGWPYPESYTFIENGKLKSPITTHRFSNLLHIPPTPPINSIRLARFGGIEKEAYLEETIEKIEKGVIITQILGLGTQDASTGNFSLVSPMGVVVENGKLKSRIDCMIRGNMFEIIEKLNTIYRDPLTERPYVITDKIELIV